LLFESATEGLLEHFSTEYPETKPN